MPGTVCFDFTSGYEEVGLVACMGVGGIVCVPPTIELLGSSSPHWPCFLHVVRRDLK